MLIRKTVCLMMLCVFEHLAAQHVFAQAPSVPIIRDRGEPFKNLIDATNVLREEGKLLSQDAVQEQINRGTCEVALPSPNTTQLTDRQIWQTSRKAHVRVGWHYLCQRCDHWHQRMAGGFFVSTNGLVVTCEHVIDPSTRSYREGYLIVTSEDGAVYPVAEVLASDAHTDVAILRVDVDAPVVALPLQTDVYPGDPAWCYSDPMKRSSYFSKGMVNRFYYDNEDGEEIIRMEVSTAWAPGSSGSAVLDQYGNAIGLVSKISAAGAPRPRGSESRDGEDDDKHIRSSSTMIVFRSAARAADVLDLTKPEDAGSAEEAEASKDE
jgi:hypothetical protein